MRNRPDKPLAIARNGLKIYSRLKAKTKMKVITPKQRKKNQTWKQITEDKIAELQGICQWCQLPGQRHGYNFLAGHHIISRRYNIHTSTNCYVAHFLCHNEIEDKQIDVRIFPNKSAWEAENAR